MTFSRHKRHRSSSVQLNPPRNSFSIFNEQEIINIDESYLNINAPINSLSISFNEKIKFLKSSFYDRDPFNLFSCLDDYLSMINFFFYNRDAISESNISKQLIKDLMEALFEKEVDKNIFSLNSLDFVLAYNNRIYPNSLYQHIFRHLEGVFNLRKNIGKIFLFGEKGMGKTHSLLTYSIFLRLNPFNIVFSIFNFEDYLQGPLIYFANEVLHSLWVLFANNKSLEIRDLEEWYYFYTIKKTDEFYHQNYLEAYNSFISLIQMVSIAYEGKVNVYFLIDGYQQAYKNDKFELINKLENTKIDSIPVKIIICCNTENNELLLDKFSEVKVCNDLESLDARIIFLHPCSILKEEDLSSFIEKRFDYTNKTIIKAVLKSSSYNFRYIINFFESVPSHTYNQFALLKENQIRAYFLDLKKNEFKSILDSSLVSLEKKAHSLYSLCSYKCHVEKRGLEWTHSKYDFFSKEFFKNYIYKWIQPELINNNIVIKFNDLVVLFLIQLQYEDYFKRIKLKNLNMKFYSEFYRATNDHLLKGIFIEELTFLFFRYSTYILNYEKRTFYHRIEKYGLYSEGQNYKEEEIHSNLYSKINNLKNLFIQNNQITSKIEKIKKFYSSDDQIFGGDKILKFPDGIYFLNQKFPLIDAIIVNQERKNLILIQIKKTILQKHLEDFFDDFHILYFLLENQEIYRKLFEIQMRQSTGINTKLQLFMKLAHYLKSGWSINLMFTYRYIDNNFAFIDDNGILDSSYISFDNILEASKLVIDDENFRKNEKILGKYQIENNNITLYRWKILHNIIMMDLNDFTAGLLEGKKFSNFIK